MEQKVESNKQNSGTSKESKQQYNYDFFISYRRTSTGAEIEDYRHSSSVARAIALELEAEGYRVFVDVRSKLNKPEECIAEIDKAKYGIVLLANYSFEKGKGGDTFRKEVEKILEKNEKSLWLNLDGSFIKDTNDNDEDLVKRVKKRTIDDLNTKRLRLIDDIHLDKIRRSRLTHKKAKSLYVAFGILLILALGGLGVLTYKIQLPEILFVGGGSVSNYLTEKRLNGKDITSCIPNSKYIHIPSEDAASVLLDLRNDSAGVASYTPIVLSTGKMVVKDTPAMKKFMVNKRIFEVLIDSVPLLVQVRGYSGEYQDSSRIPANLLLEWLRDTHNFVYKTSNNSGTYTCYQNHISGENSTFDFQKVNHLRDFNPKTAADLFEHDTTGRIRVILANKYYKYLDDDSLKNYMVVRQEGDTNIWKVPLYIYAASEKKPESGMSRYRMSRTVYNILHQIDTNVQYIWEGYHDPTDDIFIQLPQNNTPKGSK